MWLFRIGMVVVPLALLAGLVNRVRQAAALVEPSHESSRMVVAIPEAPGVLDPRLPAGTGARQEIMSLLYDRLLVRGDDLMLRPHILEDWQLGQRVRCLAKDEVAAEAAVEEIELNPHLWQGLGVTEAACSGEDILVTVKGFSPTAAETMLKALRPEYLKAIPIVRLTLKESVRQSLEDYLAGSLEKSQIRHLEYDDERTARLWVAGEMDLFLKELKHYYESNRQLDPSIELLEPGDHLVEPHLLLQLRQGVLWHDGTPVTAEDVAFTWQTLSRPESAWPLKQAFAPVKAVDQSGPLSLRVVYREYYAPAIEGWEAMPLLPAHLLGGGTGGDPWEAYLKHPVGCGPYQLVARTGQGGLTLERFRSYFLGAPKQPRIEYRVLPGSEARAVSLKLGRIDLVHPTAAGERPLRREPSLEFIPDVARFQTFVAWNLDHAWFSSQPVRRALAGMVDLEKLRAGMTGPVEPCRGLFYPGIWFCKKTMASVPYQPDLSAGALIASGWRIDEGIWRNETGEDMRFRLLVDAENPLQMSLAGALAEAWQERGVGVEIEPLRWSTLMERVARREFDAAVLTWELGYLRDQRFLWHSEERGAGNFTGLNDEETDLLTDALRHELDGAKVRELAEGLQDRIAALSPMLQLCAHGAEIAVLKDSLRVLRPQGDGKWVEETLAAGPLGLSAQRPWWVKRGAEEQGMLGPAAADPSAVP
ncbi:MAG: ABC transporter substrate-binding protein [Verrucomicrobiales bacterium]